MTRLEMVEKVREKTGVSYEVAKDTLEAHNWDIIDTVMVLDKDVPVQPAAAAAEKPRAKFNAAKVGDKVCSALKWICSFINKGEALRLEISRHGENVESLSVTVVILLLLLKWWIPVLAAVVGLFCGYRYSFSSNSAAGKVLNKLSAAVGNKAEEIKNKFSEEDK